MLAAAASFTFVSCGDDDDDNNNVEPTPTKTEMLTDKNWKLTGETMSGNGVTMDTFGQMPACEKDDITKFTKDMKVTFDEGATKCSSSAPQSTTGTWEFTSNETKLKLTESGFSQEFDIVELSASKTVIKATEHDTIQGTPISITITRTFSAQ